MMRNAGSLDDLDALSAVGDDAVSLKSVARNGRQDRWTMTGPAKNRPRVRPDGEGCMDLWMATRRSIADHFGPAINLGPPINTTIDEGIAFVSADRLGRSR